MSIGENIRKYRKESNLTQKELATKIGLSLTSICNYENNKREPNATIIKSVSNCR